MNKGYYEGYTDGYKDGRRVGSEEALKVIRQILQDSIDTPIGSMHVKMQFSYSIK